ncbi:MAG: response regulator [Gemmatimonadota bacterium]
MARVPLVLIVSEHEWASRSLDSVLAPKGYAVLRAYNGAQAMERASGSNPDAVFIGQQLPDMTGNDLCRKLLIEGQVSKAAPLLVFGTDPATREDRISTLQSGGWDLLSLPLDPEELLLRLERYVAGKVEGDRVVEGGLVDPSTGLYSYEGIVRRVREIGSAASRFHRPMACIVFAREDESPAQSEADRDCASQSLASMMRAATRAYDVLGRIGPLEFVVLAPDTNEEGAGILANRIRAAAGSDPSLRPSIRTGVYAVDDLHEANLDPTEMLIRATMAARCN